MSAAGIRRCPHAPPRRPDVRATLALLGALHIALLAGPACAQEQPPPFVLPLPRPEAAQPVPPEQSLTPVTGEELRAEVPGSTLTGRHDNGMPYSEYHSLDGRIFGHNNFEPVRDGCWAIRGDSICYSYETGQAPGLFCWRFFKAANGSYRILLPETGTRGTATITKGNPENFSDNGKPWTCQALMSMR